MREEKDMFRLPENVVEGLEEYRRALSDFTNGKLSANRFKGIRVPWGVYSHRGGRSYMVRIRVPAGMLLPEQLKACCPPLS